MICDDIRPRMQLTDQPLWPCDLVHDASYDPLYIQLPDAVIELHPQDLLDPVADAVDLVIGATAVCNSSTGVVDLHVAERALRLSCEKRVLLAPMLVTIELPEGNRIVFFEEQVGLILARRLQHLESVGG